MKKKPLKVSDGSQPIKIALGIIGLIWVVLGLAIIIQQLGTITSMLQKCI